MQKRPLVILAVGFVLGILAAAAREGWLLVPVISVLVLLTVPIKKDKGRAFAVFCLFLFLVSFMLGWYKYQKELEFRAVSETKLPKEERILVQGKLDKKEFKNKTYQYYLKNCSFVLSNDLIPCNQILAETKQDFASIGEILIVEGAVSAFHPSRNEGNFDEASFYQSQKIDLKLKEIQIYDSYGKPDAFRENLFLLRQKIRNVYETCMPKESGGVLAMMVLGEKSLIDQEVKELYQKTGISHVLAISGLHISVIGMTLYKLIRKVCGSAWIAGLAGGALMLSYGYLTGLGASSVRAMIMFLLLLTAQAVGRSYDSLSALGLAAVLLLWQNPFLLSYAGFLFSFVAVIGVVLVANIIKKALGSRTEYLEEAKTFGQKSDEKEFGGKKLREKAASFLETFYTSFSIQLMTLPLTAYFYYEIPVYGMFVNLLILPWVGLLLAFGIAGGIIGLYSLPLAKGLLLPCRCILAFYQWLSALVQKLPYAVIITGQPERQRMFFYYFLLFGLLFWIAKQRKQRFFGAVGTLLLVYVLTVPQKAFELDVLDVGQGDGIYLRTEAGTHLFFDGGSSDVSQVGTYRILPFLKYKGVKAIDYWFVSHTDKDHISGLQELLEAGYPIKTLVFAEGIAREEAYLTLLALAEQNKTEVLAMEYGDILHLGSAALTCVFPYAGFSNADKNAYSLVLLYEENGFTGLFTGDIGESEESFLAEKLQARQKMGLQLDFYKTAHHGSKYSNSEALLSAVKPQFAVISSGKKNRYGHPHKEAVERMHSFCAEIFYTMESGRIRLSKKAGKLLAEAYCVR